MPDDGEQRPSGPPDYKVYRSRRGLFSRLASRRSLGPARAREAAWRSGRRRDGEPRAPERRLPAPRTPAQARPQMGRASPRWAGSCSASSPSRSPPSCSRSSSPAKRRTPCTATRSCCPAPQTILVLGTDARPPDTKEPGAAPSEECFEQQAHGDAPTTPCSRRRIPRRHADADPRRRRRLPQTLDPARQLRRDPRPERRRRSTAPSPSAAPRCRSKTIEQFLGIEIDHVAIVDFTGFEDLIDAVGGVEVDVPHKLCADISGGAGGGQGGVTLRLSKGENTLNGEKALAYARDPQAERMPRPGQERLLARLQRLRPRAGPAGGDQRHQGPPHRPPPPPLQLHQGPDHRLGRAEGLRQRHGLLHDAAAGPRRRDRRQRPRRRPLRRRPTPAAARRPGGSIEVPESVRRQAVNRLLNG